MLKNIVLIVRDLIVSLLLSFIVLTGFIGILTTLFICTTNELHVGKDTVEFFGNGRFQIIKIFSGEYRSFELHLWDAKEKVNIEFYIDKYKEINNKVYITGENGYTVLDYKNGTYVQSNDLIAFSLEDQNVFLHM